MTSRSIALSIFIFILPTLYTGGGSCYMEGKGLDDISTRQVGPLLYIPGTPRNSCLHACPVARQPTCVQRDIFAVLFYRNCFTVLESFNNALQCYYEDVHDDESKVSEQFQRFQTSVGVI